MISESKQYPHIYQIAHDVQRHITSLPSPIRHLHLQPLNYQIPRRTSWWMVPTQRMPFYKYSKLFFHHIPAYSPDIIAGFSFERGLGGQLNGLADDVLLLQADWYWRRFLNDVIAGTLSTPVQEVELRTKTEILLIVELYDFIRLHRRHLETKDPDDILIFRMRDGLDKLSVEKAAQRQLQTLESAHRCYDLVINTEIDPDFAWYWLRFTLGVVLPKQYTGTGDDCVARLWSDVLSPWLSLVG